MHDKRRILIVDDDPTNIQLLMNALQGPYDICAATNGCDAISQVKKTPPDLLILDVMMPDLNGFDVCKIIKAEEAYADIPILFLTAKDAIEAEIFGLELGGIDYLKKPVNLDLLKLRVRNHIELKCRNDLVKQQRDQMEYKNIGIESLSHALEVHQKELELQNEKLCREREKSELLRNMYTELYDLAPIAYFSFDTNGVIKAANHFCAQLLEVDLESLINFSFSDFISESDEKEFFLNHISLVLQKKLCLKCSINLTRKDGTLIHAQLQSIAVNTKNRESFILSSIVDETTRKQFEEKLKRSHDQLEGQVLKRTVELTDEKESLRKAYIEIELLKNMLQAENIYLQQEVNKQYNFGEIIGQCNALSRIFAQIEQVAPMNATVLLLGETGTGKGVAARAIHNRSARKNRSLVTVNCATLPAALVESELFGRERGAFTGSDTKQIGRFELADGGTIFLDEICELPFDLQSKLLRVIQDGEFERLGSPRTIKTDVRIIAATNRNIIEEVRNGKFREDLFYRLNVFPITMPPLRQRKDDIPLLVKYFIAKFNLKIGKKIEKVTNETMIALQGYYWPGNVRELESIIERAVIISQGGTLQVLERFDTTKKAEELVGQDVKALVELEHDHILHVLKKTGWRIEGTSGAAILLGLNASTLRARMRKYGIVRQ